MTTATQAINEVTGASTAPARPVVAGRHGRLRVCLVMPLADKRGGSEVMLLNLLRANRRGPRVDYRLCFLEDGPMVGQARDLGYDAVVIRAGRLRQGLRYLATVARFGRWLSSQSPDLVLAFMGKGHLYAGPAAWLAGYPAAWWQHSIDPGSWLDRVVTAIPAVGICCASRATADAQHRHWPRRPTRVCYGAVDLARFCPERLPPVAQARAALGLPVDGPVVVCVARLQSWKGIHVFVDAAAIVLRDRPAARFVVVGGADPNEPAYADQVRAQADRLNMGPGVRFVGRQADVPLWMHAADTVVHASVKPEAFGLVIVEAMAMEKPVVAAGAGGPLEIIDPGVNGYLHTPGDAPSLATAITRSLTAGAANRLVSANARRRAAEFTDDRLAVDAANHLRAFASAGRAARSSGRPTAGTAAGPGVH